jgi:hypothetical protein
MVGILIFLCIVVNMICRTSQIQDGGIKIRTRVTEVRIRIKRVGGTCSVHEWSYFDIQNV